MHILFNNYFFVGSMISEIQKVSVFGYFTLPIKHLTRSLNKLDNDNNNNILILTYKLE